MTKINAPPVAMTIAGSDSGGGAGIQADLKTFAALGLHGTVAVTAITAQNTTGVSSVHEIPPGMVRAQIDAIVRDMDVKFVKTGMLSSSPIICEVSRSVMEHGLVTVVDPVMVAKSGAPLLKGEAVSSMKDLLIPSAYVLTPNIDEASVLTQIPIKSLDDVLRAGKALLDMGARHVVVKGGHLPGDPVDTLFSKGMNPVFYRGTRIPSRSTHGTGCTFSAAVVSYLALGRPVEEAVKMAKLFVSNAILFGLEVGRGIGPVNPVSNLEIDAERFRVSTSVGEGIYLLESSEYVPLLSPECQINLAMSLPLRYATGVESVCGVPGRISNAGGRLKAASCPAFGGSWHVARAILSAMKYDPEARSAMNIRYSDEMLRTLKDLGYSCSSYDRTKEPEDVKSAEGASIPWGIGEAVRSFGRVPDVVYHTGGWGKEPMMLVFGKDAVEVAMRAIRIARRLAEIRHLGTA
ncbi:MAG: bifunctional hydroxymethylpyrimidine kinase/phosphomethylpyrimidine kinase [Candidatus Methanosuratus sp.]|nr:bifunctional hydroxymethylpyrimidine kinase/phosphomethylpyrimidine kinase [Candidatus Methanosuratincola sp.]